ncbi:MAG: TIGR00730 family Rossman fold protein [Planctomycetia bacterium]|nr:TIGR00730 family Rossman fold protein [Planctomycetia bacterium]
MAKLERSTQKKNSGPDTAELTNALLTSPSYIKAYEDEGFMQGEDARELRLLAEYVKADSTFNHRNILSTIIVFGSARILPPDVASKLLTDAESELARNPDSAKAHAAVARAREKVTMSHYYEMARRFAEIVSEHNQIYDYDSDPTHKHYLDYVICTGGGPGIMEAANRGAYDAGGVSIGLNISLPFEQRPNPYITPDLCFQYHYFAIRKLHFMMRARALVVFPGGFGTFDELFEGLTLRQTGRMQALPIIMFGEDFWRKCINFEYLAESGVISPEDLNLFTFVKTPDEAWTAIRDFYLKR